MFKAFLRTDGNVTVSGGDIAWHRQRKDFQKLCTVIFAYHFKSLPSDTCISDFDPQERTMTIEETSFVGSDHRKVSEYEYTQCRRILNNAVSKKEKDNVIPLSV